jgi:hypothetical protein
MIETVSKGYKILYVFITIILLSLVTTTIFSFFGVGFDIYGNYLLWFIALAIIYSILPSKSGTLFSN